MAVKRKPLQGVLNIFRFNWHFYVFSGVFIAFLCFLSTFLTGFYQVFCQLILVLSIFTTLISLFVSFWIYDASNLYSMQWLNHLTPKKGLKIVNINAGFDETSALIDAKFDAAELTVLDFYDPLKHTEISIKRARKAYPPYRNTVHISTEKLPISNDSIDILCAVLSAHEIRNTPERIQFFKEINRVLKPEGSVFVTEHLRDLPNFLAFNIGFLHFHSFKSWEKTFSNSGFKIERIEKTTPFVTTFILKKNGNTL